VGLGLQLCATFWNYRINIHREKDIRDVGSTAVFLTFSDFANSADFDDFADSDDSADALMLPIH